MRMETLLLFTATTIVDESVMVDENPSNGELSENADLQEACNNLCKVATKNAMNVDLGLKEIASLELDKKNQLLKLFDTNELVNKVKTKNMLLLDKVENLELELSVAKEQTNRSASSKLDHMLSEAAPHSTNFVPSFFSEPSVSEAVKSVEVTSQEDQERV